MCTRLPQLAQLGVQPLCKSLQLQAGLHLPHLQAAGKLSSIEQFLPNA